MSFLLIWSGILLVLVGLIIAYRNTLSELDNHQDERPILPSHYSIERYMIRTEYVPETCRNCGTENDESYTYCTECGEKLDGSVIGDIDLRDLHQ